MALLPLPYPDPASRPGATFARRILLAVCGLTPQIVTETLYALATADAGAAFSPTEVHLITTAEGALRAELSLLSRDLGWFHRFCADYGLHDVDFDSSHIHVMRDARGQPIDDLRRVQDNEAAADFITEQVRLFTSDSDSALHVSIAGGRKTMGFYLGYALSLFGRPQDRLSHVLVSEPFESSWDFFYPTPYSRVLQTRDGKLADSAQAQVTLAEIPFVSLRHGLPQDLLQGRAGFNATVVAARAALAPPELAIDLGRRRIRAAGKVIELPPAALALLGVFARRTAADDAPLQAPKKDAADLDWARRYLREYRAITGSAADIEATARALRNGMDGQYFSSCKSKLERRLKAALGPAAQPYLIHDGGCRPRRYGLKLPPDSVRFETITNF